MHYTRIPLSKEARLRVRERFQHKCAKRDEQGILVIHHILPVSEGGTNADENLQLLCMACHKATHAERGDWYAVLMSSYRLSKALKAKFDDHGYLFWPNKPCVKSFQGVPYPLTMTRQDIGSMCMVAKRLLPSNMLGIKTPKGTKADDITMISLVLGISESQAYRFVERMTKLGMMAKVRITSGGQSEVQYYVNPIYWFSGNRIPLNLYLLFRVQLNAVLPGWVIRRYGNLIELQHHKK